VDLLSNDTSDMDRNHPINVDETLIPENKKLKTSQDLKITAGGAVDRSGAIDYWYYAVGFSVVSRRVLSVNALACGADMGVLRHNGEL
jgi:hypothetical protein